MSELTDALRTIAETRPDLLTMTEDAVLLHALQIGFPLPDELSAPTRAVLLWWALDAADAEGLEPALSFVPDNWLAEMWLTPDTVRMKEDPCPATAAVCALADALDTDNHE